MTMISDVTPSQSQQHKTWKDAHLRLVNTPKKPNVVALVAPTTDPAADVMDIIIAAVGNSLGVPVNQIIAGVSTPENISARKLAMALCVRRPCFTVKCVTDHFEVSDYAVRDAVSLLDPILSNYAITSKTPLQLSMPIISREWALTMENLRRNPTIREIQSEVCRVFNIRKNELFSRRRAVNIVRPRQAALALCKRLTLQSLPEIGRRFGGLDHTTVLHAARRFKPIIDAVAEKIIPDTSVAGWAAAVYAALETIPLADLSKRKKSL